VSTTLALFTGLHRYPKLPDQRAGRTSKPKYKVSVIAKTNLRIETMKPYMTKIMGSGVLNSKTLALLSAANDSNTPTTYGGTIHRYFAFCDEAPACGAAAGPRRGALASPWAPTSKSTRGALVNLIPCHAWHGRGLNDLPAAAIRRMRRCREALYGELWKIITSVHRH
jgi:hypothetical protein